jgi:hypothetical protein
MSTPAPAPVPSVEPPSTAAPTTPVAKPGVFVPWVFVILVLVLSLAQHVVMDPISEAIEQINILKQLVSSSFPEFLQGAVGEFLSWTMALGIQTPYGSVFGIIVTGIFIGVALRPFLGSLLGAFFVHPLLFLTGGTDQGWRYTWRTFAFNRIAVELVSIACFLGIGYAPLSPAWKISALLILIPGIRLIGMGTLFAQLARGQGLGFFRAFFLLGPLFALFAIISMVLSVGSVIWVGLWCIAKVG